MIHLVLILLLPRNPIEAVAGDPLNHELPSHGETHSEPALLWPLVFL
jgi:hypothetical protein